MDGRDTALIPQRAVVTHARMLSLAAPMMLANMTTPLLGMADTAVIGSLRDAALVGGIASATIVFDFIFWSFGFLRVGTAGLTAQAIGAGDPVEQRATLARALILASGIGVVLVALQGLIAPIAFRLIDASPAVTSAANDYFAIRVWSAPFTLCGYAVFGAIVGRGRTAIGLAIQVVINLVNIALNVLFVIGLAMGVRGSALATLIAEIAGLLLCLIVVRPLSGPLFGIARSRVFHAARLRRMLALNRDIMIRTAALIFVSAFFLRRGAHASDATLAANAALMTLAMALVAVIDGFGTAAEQMCGQSFGARDEAGFRRAARLVCFWSVACAACLTLVALALGGYYVDAIAPTLEARDVARAGLLFAALLPLVGAIAFAMDGVFIGAGWGRDMRNTMLVAALVYLALAESLDAASNAALWTAQLFFYAARGLGQLWIYPRRVAEAFPAAQSAASTPTASVMRS